MTAPTVTIERRPTGWQVVVQTSAVAGVAFRVGDRAHVIAGQTRVVVEQQQERAGT